MVRPRLKSDLPPGKIGGDDPATVDLKLAKNGVALKDGAFPNPKRQPFGFIAAHEAFHGLEEIQAELWGVCKEMVSLRCLKDPSGQALFDEVSPRAILIFVNFGPTLALDPQERASCRRPSKHRRIGQMEDVVESIIVLRQVIVGKSVTQQNPA
jgi:hypothetical protein